MVSIRLAELHSFIVHFSIALLVVSVLLDLAAVIFRRASLVDAASWTLLIGVPLMVAAMFSGWLSEHHINVGAGYTYLRLHKITSLGATVVFLVLFLARLTWLSSRLLGWLRLAFPRAQRLASAQGRISKALPQAYVRSVPRGAIVTYLLLSIIGVALLAATAYLGAAMVYRFGIGVFNPTAPLP